MSRLSGTDDFTKAVYVNNDVLNKKLDDLTFTIQRKINRLEDKMDVLMEALTKLDARTMPVTTWAVYGEDGSGTYLCR